MIDYRIKQHPPTMGQYIARKLANLFVLFLTVRGMLALVGV